MAQLRDSTIDGNLEVTGNTIFKTNGRGIHGVHPETGETSSIISLNSSGNTLVGYGGYVNKNGNSHICGNEIFHFVASAGLSYRPYYRTGDVIDFTGNAAVKTAGYVSNNGKYVIFTIPVSKPVIGSPSATITSGQGFILRQGGNYTHGSSASVYVKPTSYSVSLNNSGFVITAAFDVTTNVTNNDTLGICWDGKITLS
jgi:hypothetical protein